MTLLRIVIPRVSVAVTASQSMAERGTPRKASFAKTWRQPGCRQSIRSVGRLRAAFSMEQRNGHRIVSGWRFRRHHRLCRVGHDLERSLMAPTPEVTAAGYRKLWRGAAV